MSTKIKIIIFWLLLVCLFPLFAKVFIHPILAFSSQTGKGGYLFSFEGAVFKTDEMNLQSFVNETFKAVVGSIQTSIIGCISCSPEERDKYPGLLLGSAGLIAGVYGSPPASGIYWLSKVGEKIRISKPVYAQTGIGFNALEAILPIWKAFRDLSYVFFVLILVFLGFAIMFRLKISPQAVITIQAAIPQIFLVLILITFSYAIAGFLIDFMFAISTLVIRTFGGIPIVGDHSINSFLDIIKAHIPGFAKNLIPDNYEFFIGTYIIHIYFMIILPILSMQIIMPSLPPFGMLFGLIVNILVLIALIRVLWLLLKTMGKIIIGVVFGPFQLLMGAFPGSKSVGNWFKGLVGNIAVFPVTLTMAYLSSYLILKGILVFFEPVINSLINFVQCLLPGGSLLPFCATTEFAVLLTTLLEHLQGGPFEWGGMIISAIVLPLVGIGIMLMIPKTAELIQSFLAGKPFDYGMAIGETTAPLVSVGRLGGVAGIEAGYSRLQASGTIGAPSTPQGQWTRAVKDVLVQKLSGKR